MRKINPPKKIYYGQLINHLVLGWTNDEFQIIVKSDGWHSTEPFFTCKRSFEKDSSYTFNKKWLYYCVVNFIEINSQGKLKVHLIDEDKKLFDEFIKEH